VRSEEWVLNSLGKHKKNIFFEKNREKNLILKIKKNIAIITE